MSTVEGTQAISTLKDSDLILAYDEATGQVGYYPVVGVWVHEDPVVVRLTIDGELIETTPEHPFYTVNGEWVAAGELLVGDQVYRADGSYGVVEAVEFVEQPQEMYNFTVAGAHTYFVGGGQWLVHNGCKLIGNKKVAEVAGNTSIKPGIQGSVTKERVELYAQDMLEGTFDWNRMSKFGRPDPIQFARLPNGELVLMEGHHRFLAAQLTNTPIPFDNPNAVVIRDLPDAWPSGEWEDYIWR